MSRSISGGRRKRVSKKSSKKSSKRLSKKSSRKSSKKGGKKTGLKRVASPVFLAYVDLRKFMAKELGVKMGKAIMKLSKIYTDLAKSKDSKLAGIDVPKRAKELFKEDKNAKEKLKSVS